MKLVLYLLMLESIKQWVRTKRRNILRDGIIATGQILDELRADRANINYEDFPDECDSLDALITKYEQQHKKLLTKFKEA